MHEMTWYSRNNRRLRCSKAEHYLHELRKQIKINRLQVVMILKKLKWPMLILHSWKEGPYKGIIKIQEIRKVRLSETHASGTEKPPLTMIGGKPTEGISTSKKDQDGHGVVKSENFQGVPNPDDELNNFFLSIWSGSDECWFFPDSFLRFRTHEVATAVCTTGGVHALTCCTHNFSAHIRTSSCVCTYTHGSSAWKGSLHVRHISPSRLLPSQVSFILAVPWRSLRDHSRLRPHRRSRPHVLAVLTRPKSAGHAPLRTCIAKFGYLTKSDANTGYDPKKFDKNTSVNDDTTLINDPDQNTSDFSKTMNENTSQFGVHTVFESSVLHVSHWWCNREIVATQRRKRRFCDQCCRVDVTERWTKRY